ncbi:TPA: hypothetical protein DDW35_11130, partial [Candidatus Sumerlaeota bacterium]|nr:hypothetical protein [Candidatus Sumerlaeota bacterium]
LQAIESNAPMQEAHRSRDLLGAFLFSGDAVEKPLRVLSGGERTRFRLAQLLFSPANLLVLDEPTNHLDITSRSTVEHALQTYTGTVIVVSHDRVFMENVTNKIIEIDNGVVKVFPGNYREYLAYKESLLTENGNPISKSQSGVSNAKAAKQASAVSAPVTSVTAEVESKPKAQPVAAKHVEPERPLHEHQVLTRDERKALSKQKRALKKGVDEAEAAVEKIENRMQEIDQAMADPKIAVDFSKLAPLTQERETLTKKHEEIIARWEKISAELDVLEKEVGEE